MQQQLLLLLLEILQLGMRAAARGIEFQLLMRQQKSAAAAPPPPVAAATVRVAGAAAALAGAKTHIIEIQKPPSPWQSV